MRYTITTKNCFFSERQINILEKQCRKLERYLPHLAVDLPLMSITIKKHQTRSMYRGTIFLKLPKSMLVVRSEKSSVDLLLREGFERLLKEVVTYKGKHFVSQSDYRDHTSIKQSTFFSERR